MKNHHLYPTNIFANQTTGLCVGGQNHGLPCGSAPDCPSKTYNDAVEEVTENGICVGSSLDKGRVIPKNTGAVVYDTLNELFAASFGAWDWYSSESRYRDKTTYDFVDKSAGTAPITPAPPRLYSLKAATNNPKVGFTWNNADKISLMIKDDQGVSTPIDTSPALPFASPFPATLQFFAFADNDQMPIVRMAVDWNDGSDPYVVKGWFKNRKPWCDRTGWKVCGEGDELNRPCNSKDDCDSANSKSCDVPSDTNNRLHFGNSFDACATGYYQFTHLYTCPGKATAEVPACSAARTTNCWDGANKKCLFKPKVQVLDNWGWCNASFSGSPPQNCQDFVGGAKGCWQGEGTDTCATTNPEPWTSFGGTIEVKP